MGRRENHGQTKQADEFLDEAFARMRRSHGNRRWHTLTKLEQDEFWATAWRNISAELEEAYAEQRAGRANYRLAAVDVAYAKREAVWRRYDVELAKWRAEPANAAAEALEERARGKTGASAVVDEDAKRRIAKRPQSPAFADPPIAPPAELERPRDWPDLEHSWSGFILELVRRRRAAVAREPGDDEPDRVEWGPGAGEEPRT